MLNSMKTWITTRLSVKIVLCIFALQVLSSAAFAFSGYYVNQKLVDKLVDQFDMRLQSDIQILSDAVLSIPGSNKEISGTDDPNYAIIKQKLEKIKAAHHLENTYILSKNQKEDHIVVLADVPEDYGTPYPFTDEMNEAITKDKEMLSSIYEDEYGVHKSIFVPIKNDKKEAYGILGIDLNAAAVPETSNTIFWSTLVITLIVLSVGTFIAILIGKLITKPLHELMDATEKIAAGDLRKSLTTTRKDEIGTLAQSFGSMSSSLQKLIRHIRSSSDQVSLTSNNLLQSANESSRSAEQAAVSSNQISDGINEIVNSVINSSGTAKEIDGELNSVSGEMKEMQLVTQQVMAQSEEGHKLVDQTLSQMNVIKQVMDHSQEAALKLGERTEEIGGVIKIISDIAEQTNLLALNASIEAARVGELGRGFAVVAGEVRKLAAQSAEATLSVRQLVSGTQENSKLVINMIAEGQQAVEQGQGWMKNTHENFNHIFTGVTQVTERTGQLQLSLENAASSFVTISAAMEQIASVTQEQAAGTEEVAAGAEQQSAAFQEITGLIGQLRDLSVELQKSVQHFKLEQQA